MQLVKNLAAILAVSTTAFAGQSSRNILNEETGDFGGAAFPLRSEIQSFIETDASRTMTGFGFYIPNFNLMDLGSVNKALGAAMDFDKSVLANPSEMPFEFIGLNYGPTGHGGNDYGVAHFDVHLWLYPNEFSRGIECNGTTFPPCQTTAWQAARFNNTPSQEYYPPGDWNSPSYWASTGGAHIWPQVSDGTFAAQPAVVVGSYLGKVIYYEPMIAVTIFQDVQANGPKDFSWPVLKYPMDGRYFTNIHIEYEIANQRFKVLFNNLVTSPETHRGSPVFVGAQFNPASTGIYGGVVSGSKDCLINNGNIIDGGYTVNYLGNEYCCRARGTYNSGSCQSTVCGSNVDLVPSSPNSFLYDPISSKCFARCVERI